MRLVCRVQAKASVKACRPTCGFADLIVLPGFLQEKQACCVGSCSHILFLVRLQIYALLENVSSRKLQVSPRYASYVILSYIVLQLFHESLLRQLITIFGLRAAD